MSDKYNHTKIELKWQDKWEKEKLYVADIDSGNKPFYNLWMFPYPSAEGMHAGHAFASTGSDIYGRYMRMKGREVFQPFGYDSFGIHSENYAIKINENPHDVVKRTTKRYEEQMRALGHGYDWTRTVTTSSPDYYKWTQWLFLKMLAAGLAYKKNAMVNFCPSCKTVLADEQVMTPKQAGKEPKNAAGEVIQNPSEDIKVCERCGTVVEKKDLDQWFFKITGYADRLLFGLEKIDWSERVVKAQRDWIGKDKGLSIHFKVEGINELITVWTKFWETIYGTTFLVLAPEHNLLKQLKIPKDFQDSVNKYIKESLGKSQIERTGSKEKSGVFTGVYATNPVNGNKVPVWVADYVLWGVGTGAVMGVPAHDERDFDFAKKYQLDIVQVVSYSNKDIDEKVKKAEISFEGEGKLVNSGKFDGMDAWGGGKEKIASWMIKEKIAEWTITYHLRDWLVSRQRYWGAPIPMIYCKSCAFKGSTLQGETLQGMAGWWPVPEKDLPVLLPNISDYKPEGTGRGPLANHKEFYEVKCPKCGKDATRETDVMDTFVDSSWYFLRYPSTCSARSGQVPFDPEITKKWLPVNLYFGGAEHSVLHLMYARFVWKVLRDMGYLAFPAESKHAGGPAKMQYASGWDEPFPRFFAHGLMIKDGAKMSKSRGNVVNPDDYIKKFGADVMRMYNMFIGPMDGSPDFRDSGIEGMQRFMNRVWSLFVKMRVLPLDSPMAIPPGSNSGAPSIGLPVSRHPQDAAILSTLHQTIKGVTEDIEGFKYNTAISKIMQMVNILTENKVTDPEILKNLALLLAPFAPHMMEEVWVEYLHQEFSVHKAKWPVYEAKYITRSEAVIIVQINGKVRSQLTVNSEQSTMEEKMLGLAKNDEKIVKWLDGRLVKKTIFVPGKLVNFVI